MKSDTHEPTLSTEEQTLTTGEPAPGESAPDELAPDQDFLVNEPLIRVDNVRSWLLEQVPLVQCFCVAVSLHITFLPIMWIMGWALPWPKPPVFTTVVEYDLTNWPKVARPKKITDYRD